MEEKMKYKGEIFRLCVMKGVCLSPSFDLLTTAQDIQSILLYSIKSKLLSYIIKLK